MLLGVSRQSVTKWEAEKSYRRWISSSKCARFSSARSMTWCRVTLPIALRHPPSYRAARSRDGCVWL